MNTCSVVWLDTCINSYAYQALEPKHGRERKTSNKLQIDDVQWKSTRKRADKMLVITSQTAQEYQVVKIRASKRSQCEHVEKIRASKRK